MTTGADRLARLLALVPWLRSHGGVTLDEAAAEFGITPDQLQKDLELLTVCGLPRQGPEDLIDIQFWGDGGISVLDPQGIARPLRLAPDEAVALIVGLRLLRELPGRHDPAVVDSLLVRLEEASGAAAASATRVAVAVDEQPSLAESVRAGLESGRALALEYLVPTRDEVTERVVDPIRVVAHGGHSYLEAWCRRAEDLRRFRLDRIVSVQATDEPAAVPSDLAPPELDTQLFRPSARDPLVSVQLEAAGSWFVEYVNPESVTDLPDGRQLVTLRTTDLRWVARLVLRLGGAATVLDPPELVELVHDLASAQLAEYGAAAPNE